MADTRAYVSSPDTFLTTGVAIGATSITVDDFVDIYGNALTLASFGGVKGYLRINPEGSGTAEDISFTGVTSNADGTYTLTGVSTLLAKTPYTETSGLVRAHSAGSIVRISNPAAFYTQFANLNNDETIATGNTWTFPNATPPKLDTYAAPTDNTELAAKKYVDDIAAGGTASINRVVVSGTAGATIAAGEVVYLDETANEWLLADASAAATCENLQLGIAQGAGTDGVAISGGVLLSGRDDNQSGLTQGDRLYISDTAGAIASSAGTVEVEIGHAVDADSIDFTPYYGSHMIKNQRDAAAGNNGTPSSSNTFVTQTGFQLAAENYATSTTGDDTYVVTLSPVPAAYAAGMVVRFKPDTANTGACTLNVNSLGAKAIKLNVSDDPPNNTIKANTVATVVYDGTNFQLINTPEALVGGTGSSGDNFHYHTYNYRLATNTSAITVSDATLTTILTGTVPGGVMGTANGVKFRFFVSDCDYNSNTITVNLKYGSTTIASAGISGGATSNHVGFVDGILLASGATSTQFGTVQFILTENNNAAAPTLITTDSGTGAEDSTGNLTFTVDVQWSGTGSNLVVQAAWAEIFRAQ